MIALLLLVACQSTPTVPAASATHAEPMATSGRPLLHIRGAGAELDGIDVSADTLSAARSSWPDTVLVAVAPDVPWASVQVLLDALPEEVGRAGLIVSDPSPEGSTPSTGGSTVDATWLDQHYALRTALDQPLITGGETRLLGTLSGASAARILAGPDRTAGHVIAALDSARSQGVGCLRTAIEVADTQPEASTLTTAQVPYAAQVSVLPITLHDDACPLPLGRLPALNLQAHADGAIGVEGGPLDADAIRAALSEHTSTLHQCVGLARDTFPEVAMNDVVKAIAQVDIGADGAAVGTRVMVAEDGAQARDVQERCVARVLHDIAFDTQGERARFLLTVAQ